MPDRCSAHNMSRLEFDVDAHQYLVKLPRVQKLPPNPLIGPAHEAWLEHARLRPKYQKQTAKCPRNAEKTNLFDICCLLAISGLFSLDLQLLI